MRLPGQGVVERQKHHVFFVCGRPYLAPPNHAHALLDDADGVYHEAFFRKGLLSACQEAGLEGMAELQQGVELLEDKMCAVTRKIKQQSVWEAFQQWRFHDHLRALLRARTRRWLRRGWRQWQGGCEEGAAMLKARRAQQLISEVWGRRADQLRALTTLRQVVTARAVLWLLMARGGALTASARMGRGVTAWAAEACRRGSIASTVSRGQRHHRKRELRRAVVCWLGAWRAGEWLEGRVCAVQATTRRAGLRRGLSGVGGEVLARTNLQTTALLCAKRMRGRCLAAKWARWQGWASQRSQRAALVVAQARRGGRRAGLSAWAGFVSALEHAQQLEEAGWAWHVRACMVQGMAALHQVASRRAIMWLLAARGGGERAYSRLGRGFAAWATTTRLHRSRATRVARVSFRRCRRELLAAFDGWLGAWRAGELLSLEQLRLRGLSNQGRFRLALVRWRRAVQHVRLLRAFVGWQLAMRMEQEEQEEQEEQKEQEERNERNERNERQEEGTLIPQPSLASRYLQSVTSHVRRLDTSRRHQQWQQTRHQVTAGNNGKRSPHHATPLGRQTGGRQTEGLSYAARVCGSHSIAKPPASPVSPPGVLCRQTPGSPSPSPPSPSPSGSGPSMGPARGSRGGGRRIKLQSYALTKCDLLCHM